MPESTPTAECAPLLLLNDRHVQWHSVGDPRRGEPIAYVRGFAYVNNRHLEGETLARHFQQLATQGERVLRDEILRLNGGWAMVVVWPAGETLAAVDRMRTIPLFYHRHADGLAIGDSGIDLSRRFFLPMSLPAQLKYLSLGYVSGAKTLYENVEQLQSGEIIRYRTGGECSRERNYRFYPTTQLSASRDDLESQLADTLANMFQRICAGIGGRRILVPLSGGLDSRLVAAMLKRAGVDDCLCYTFGDETGEEATISKQVAESLGFAWRCFPYSIEEWTKWNTSEVFRDYWRYACKGVSKPITQDFPAAMQMVEEGLDPQQAIFFPGHTGDMVSGGHIPKQYRDLDLGKASVVDEIVRFHSRPMWFKPQRLLQGPLGRQVLNDFQLESAPPGDIARPDNTACFEMWDAEQRQPLYIINSVRVYEFIGASWRTMWDYELMDFFLSVPKELRYGQRLYLSCLKNKIFVDELGPLAQIPIAGHGSLASTKSLRGPARSATLGETVCNGLLRQLHWWKATSGRKLRRAEIQDTILNTLGRLAGLGIHDGSISFGEALDAMGFLPMLHPEIRQILKPWLRFRLDSVPWLTAFTVIALAEMSRDERS